MRPCVRQVVTVSTAVYHSSGDPIEFKTGLREAHFIERLNRFAVRLLCDGEEVVAHMANSGRLDELLRPENAMYLSPVPPDAERKTRFDLTLVRCGDALVSADARLPNKLVVEAIEADRLAGFGGYPDVRTEVTVGHSRIDIVLGGPGGECYVEVKSVTLVEDGVGLFPDAPTERGRKHLGTLVDVAARGHRAAVAFVVQRADVSAFSPNRAADPEFCDILLEVAAEGVEVYAYKCAVSLDSITISAPLPVRL